jgi:hypothetical protein
MRVESKEPYVFQKHCNQVFFYPDVLDGDWWFVLRHDPRSKHIFEKTKSQCEVKKIIRVMETKSDLYMICLDIYIVDVPFYYGYL